MSGRSFTKRWTAASTLLTGCVLAPVLSGCAEYDSAYYSERVTVCHESRTIVIPEVALTEHIGHGDEQGPCEE